MDRVRFVEPFRTVSYAPQYVALGLGLFAGEGLEADLATATAPAGVTRALLSGEAEIGVSGPIRALVAADRGEGRILCIAELSSRAGFFLLGRSPAEAFAWRDLSGKRVLVFGEAPTPRLCLEYLLERHGVGLASVDLVPDLPTGRAVETFLAGRAEYLLQGQPVAEQLLAGGQAHLAAALGPALGPVAFSAYLATPRLLAERGPVVDAALRALYRAQRWLHGHSAAEIADAVAWAFPQIEAAILVAAVRRYLAGRTWAPDPVLRRSGFDALQEILLLRGAVRRSHAYDEIVDVERAQAAVRAAAAP